MKNVFIDFEASQYTQEIISIGAVMDTGEEFYSLIKINHDIGFFVSNLTNIKKENLENAPKADKVFDYFYNWLVLNNKDGDRIQFICYGNSDLTFANNTLKTIKNSFFAQSALSLIINNIVDYAEYIKAYFGLSKHVSLIKVAQYYSNEQLTQDHNALNDAKLLKFVYENIQKGEKLVENPFREYAQKIEVYENENLIETFYGMAEAIKWLKTIIQMPKGTQRKRIENKIISASQQQKSYCGYNWILYE